MSEENKKACRRLLEEAGQLQSDRRAHLRPCEERRPSAATQLEVADLLLRERRPLRYLPLRQPGGKATVVEGDAEATRQVVGALAPQAEGRTTAPTLRPGLRHGVIMGIADLADLICGSPAGQPGRIGPRGSRPPAPLPPTNRVGSPGRGVGRRTHACPRHRRGW